MKFGEWLDDNTLAYRGYSIRPGAIYRNGEVVLMFDDQLSATKDESFERGREIIDRLLTTVRRS